MNRPPRDLYRRWMAWGVLSSHTRAHGIPPREPWEYDAALTDDFRRALNLRYSLMPYIYAHAKDSSARGFPMLRPLFFEYPNDPGSWTIDDHICLDRTCWWRRCSRIAIDAGFICRRARGLIISNKVYQGAGWHEIQAGAIPIILLVKKSIRATLLKAQHEDMDWTMSNARFQCRKCTGEGTVHEARRRSANFLWSRVAQFVLAQDPQAGKVKWTIIK